MLFFCNIGIAFAQTEVVNNEKISDAVTHFFKQVENISNRTMAREVKDFYSFYAKSDALFVKESFMLDENNNITNQDKLEMNKEQYIEYLLNVLQKPQKYSVAIKVLK